MLPTVCHPEAIDMHVHMVKRQRRHRLLDSAFGVALAVAALMAHHIGLPSAR